MAQVLGHPRPEASEMLRNGDIAFILQAELSPDFTRSVSQLKQLESIHPAAPFYAGLLIDKNEELDHSVQQAGSDGSKIARLQILLFCAALESPCISAGKEAARKLIPLILESGDVIVKETLGFLDAVNRKVKTEIPLTALRSACLYRLGRYDEAVKFLSGNSVPVNYAADWEKAFALFAAWKISFPENAERFRQEIPAFLFESSSGSISGESRRWALREVLSSNNREGFLSQEEIAVLYNRHSPVPYPILLNSMQPALSDGGLLFFRYPDILADLGRAYQYTSARREEGLKLFKSWTLLLDAPAAPGSAGNEDFRELKAFIKNLDNEALKIRKFLLLYYSGRIERAMETYAASSESFERAKEFAPNYLQYDACIWYMLMNALNKDPLAAVPLVLSTMSQWNDLSYFSDILDRLSSYLTGKRQWTALMDIFCGLESRKAEGASLAQYAWILGRAAEEAYIKTDRSAESFFRIAFEQGKGSFYYRAMAASKLKATFAPETDNTDTEIHLSVEQEDAAAFILGFFECGSASFVQPYLDEQEKDLDISGLRKTAEALSLTGRWKESLDLISRYTSRENYELSRRDLVLFYPRPFLELVEKYSGETEQGEEILYGLIRTESYFMPEVVSRSGAVGLSQLMMPTAEEMAGRITRRGGPDYRSPGGINLKDPEVNVHIGSFYLRYLSEQMGSPMLALLAYNGGMGRMRRWLAMDRQQKDGGLPHDLFLETIEFNETREYGRRVLAAAAVYGYLYYGMSMEQVAADIYKRY